MLKTNNNILAGGDWNIIERIIQEELNGEDVTVVKYVP